MLSASDFLSTGLASPRHAKPVAFVVALAMVASIALLDFNTGYEIRLAILYLLPIALASWVIGPRAGLLVAVISASCWLYSFNPVHHYTRPIYLYWEAGTMLGTFMLFVWLLQSLRSALKRADRRFLNVLESLPVGVAAFSESGTGLLYANPQFNALLGMASPATYGSLQPDVLQHRLLPLAGRSTAASPASGDFEYGEVQDPVTGRTFLQHTGAMSWPGIQRVRVVVLLDVTAQKKAESLERRHQEMLHKNARLTVLAEIAATLAHEINQPLMAIATYADACSMLLAADPPQLEAVGQALEKSRAQAIRASQIIERTRRFLRSRVPGAGPARLNEVVVQAVKAMESQWQEKPVEMQLLLDPQLPEVSFDPGLIEQVLINLLSNAGDAVRALQESGGIVIRTRRVNASVQIDICDSGPGVDPALSESMYQAFVTSKPGGLGLGLAISRSIIEAHGGKLWHEPGQPDGACFHVSLPA